MAEARLRQGSKADPAPADDLDEDLGTEDGAEGTVANEPGEDDDAAGDGSVVVDAETGDEQREAKRLKNREDRMRRKEAQRKREEAYQRKIEMLERDRAEMMRRLERVEGHTSNQDIQRVDQAIVDVQRHLQHWKKQIADATAIGDGTAVADAQERWYEARSRLDALNNIKQAAVEQQKQPKTSALDPRVQAHYDTWVRDHPWYNGAGRDQDSRIMLAIDNALADEGYDPSTSEYWAELTRRGKQQLPHRFKRGAARQEIDDDDDEDDGPMTPAPRARRPAPQISGGSSRESVATSRSEYRLSPDRVRAMKEAGIWDDPKERADMVKRYREMDRANGVNR